MAASLGWMLDSMDVMIYALVLSAVQLEMHLSAATSGAMMSATPISAAVGPPSPSAGLLTASAACARSPGASRLLRRNRPLRLHAHRRPS